MIIAIVAFVICLTIPALLKKPLAKNKLSTAKEKPMLLGLSVYAAIAIVVLGALHYYNLDSQYIVGILAGSLFILLLGIIDDICKLSVKAKLSGQILVAVITVLLGIKTSIIFFPGWINMLITVLWIILLVNAFNLLDIMDGLCIGISLIIAVVFLSLSIITGAVSAKILFCGLSGALLAATIYNLPPARLYLGDSGSMLLGYIFACSALNISYAPNFNQWFLLFIPILIVALPLCDLVFTIFMRIRRGLPIMQKSDDHLVLVMKEAGVSRVKILIFMYGVCVAFGASAILLLLTR